MSEFSGLGNAPIIKKIGTDRVIDLIGKLKSLKSSAINASAFIVFKVSCELNEHLIHDQRDCEQVFIRSNGKSFYTLIFDQSDGRYKFYKIENNRGVLNESRELQVLVCQRDLTEVLQQSKGGCIHNPPKNTHFKTPSGLHTKSFLRLADAIHSYNALDRISYWLQSSMINADAVLADNWSLSPIVLQGQIILNRILPFDCLSNHIDYDLEEAKKLIKNLINKIKPGAKILVVVSVNASGNFSSKLLNLCRDLHQGYQFESVSIYQLPNVIALPIETLCLIRNDAIEFFSESDCPYCKAGEITHLIDSRYYYPRIDEENKIKLKSKYIEAKNSNFIRTSLDQLGAIEGVFSVHKDDPNDGITPRHHAYYVDVLKLIEHQRFLDGYDEVLQLIFALDDRFPDVIICPPHEAGVCLSDRAKKYFGCNVIQTHDMKLNSKEMAAVKKARHICIVDDVLISGSRLATFNRALREDVKPSSLGRVSYVIAVSRTENESKFTSIRDALVIKHDWNAEIYFVYKIYLPTWEENQCPWCKELEVWEQCELPFSPPEYYRSRSLQLNSRSNTGILTRPFARLDGIDDIYVGASSPMANAGSSEMVALFNITVTLQMMRNEEDKSSRLERMLYRNNSLDGGMDGNFRRYSEPLIQACLLKNTRPNEWSSDIISSGINSLIDNFSDKNTHILILEVLIFLLRYSPRENVDIDKLKNALKDYLSNDDPVKDLLSIVEGSVNTQ
jgi:hypothetical protein